MNNPMKLHKNSSRVKHSTKKSRHKRIIKARTRYANKSLARKFVFVFIRGRGYLGSKISEGGLV